MISVAIFASVLPARASTAAILMVLIVGDLIAVWNYRRDCDVPLLRSLVPSVLPGLVLGSMFLALVDDGVLRRAIGVLLLAMVALQLLVNARRDRLGALAHGKAAAAAAGAGAGFATMTANAAGAVMTVFLVAKRVDKVAFVGTSAWFFLGINLAKLPFSIALGLLDWPMCCGPSRSRRSSASGPGSACTRFAGSPSAPSRPPCWRPRQSRPSPSSCADHDPARLARTGPDRA